MPLFKRKGKTKTPKPKRPWSLTAVAVLLLVQGLALVAVGVYAYPYDLLLKMQDVEDFYHFLLLFLPTAVYGLVGLVVLLACLDMLRVTGRAWINAMLLQGIVLLAALLQYFGSRPFYIYPLMAFSIFVVIYLHYIGTPQGFRFLLVAENVEETP